MASFPARPGATASRRADQPPPIRRAAPGGSSRTRATATQSAVDGNAPGHPSESVLPRRDRAERGPGRPGSPYASADVPAIRPVQPYAAMPVSASRAGSSARRRPGTHPTAPSRNRPNWMICIPGYIAAGDVKPSLFGVMRLLSVRKRVRSGPSGAQADRYPQGPSRCAARCHGCLIDERRGCGPVISIVCVPDVNIGDAVPFEQLQSADLVLGCVYRGGSAGSVADDPLNRLIPVGNAGGFRYKGSSEAPLLIALYTTGAEDDWPDSLDPLTSTFTYYGDNRKPGRNLLDTPRHGNEVLRRTFERAHGDPRARAQVAPHLLFAKAGQGRDVVFRGLLVAGHSG